LLAADQSGVACVANGSDIDSSAMRMTSEPESHANTVSHLLRCRTAKKYVMYQL
jgi:hypothetical protein